MSLPRRTAALPVTTNGTNATISGTQTLELFGPSAENIGFASGSTGTLQLDAATSYTGKVSGLALGNALDLANVPYTAGITADYQPNTSGPAGGLLTVGSANIALLGNYIASTFVASSDGHGGTTVAEEAMNQQPMLAQLTIHDPTCSCFPHPSTRKKRSDRPTSLELVRKPLRRIDRLPAVLLRRQLCSEAGGWSCAKLLSTKEDSQVRYGSR